MRRKLFGIALTLLGLVCLMGADTIAWNAGQPNPNPGGNLNELEGAGTFAVDPNNKFSSLTLNRQVPGQFLVVMSNANTANGNWNSTQTNVAAGNYDTWGELVTTKGLQVFVTKTAIVNVNVK